MAKVPDPREYLETLQGLLRLERRVSERQGIFSAEVHGRIDEAFMESTRALKNSFEALSASKEVDQRLDDEHRPPLWEDDITDNAIEEQLPEAGRVLEPNDLIFFKLLEDFVPGELLGDTEILDLLARDQSAVPPLEDREGYYSGSDVNDLEAVGLHTSYWLSGLADYLEVSAIAANLGIEVTAMLDFGAASGRVARHFQAQSDNVEVWACDLNRRHVRWMHKFLPRAIRAFENSTLPNLPIEDSSLDLVVGFSVFTHIDVLETAWLAELRRILRPGGMAFLTIHDESTWSDLGGSDNGQALLEALKSCQGFDLGLLDGDLPSERPTFRFSTHGPYRANVFHSSDYINQVWGRFFELKESRANIRTQQVGLVLVKD